MPTLTIRKLSQGTHDALKMLAAQNGRSMEAEARRILGESIATAPDQAAFAAAVHDAQKAFAAYRIPEVLLSEELMAERRLEASTETVEANRWLAAAGRKNPAPTTHAKPRS
jgi:plasmid stability protein